MVKGKEEKAQVAAEPNPEREKVEAAAEEENKNMEKAREEEAAAKAKADAEAEALEETAAREAELETRSKEKEPDAEVARSIDVNKYSSRLDLLNAGLTLGLDEKSLDKASSQEELWHMVKTKLIALKTVVTVEPENKAGYQMKCNLKHAGQFYKKGEYYELGEEIKNHFLENYYI